jgi:branched-chain amino acid transport system permease protein
MKKKRSKCLCGVLLLVALAVMPLVFDPKTSYTVYFFFIAFIYVSLTQAWNIVAGYTGQISLGTHAFFGLGGYLIAITWSRGLIGYLDPLGMLMGGSGAAILAIAVGVPLLSKLREDYFALGTLGLGEILRLLTIQGGDFTKGPSGILLPSTRFDTITPHYYIGLLIALLTIITTWCLARSRIGLALVAIRDDEMSAAASGINTLRFKLFAFSLGAFFAGLCGALYAYYIFQVEPQSFFSLDWTLYPVLMCILGGPGTLSGPVMGAVFLSAIFETAKYFLPEIHSLSSGALVILAILFLPKGLIGIDMRWMLRWRRRTDQHRGTAGTAANKG